jgi:phage major head subunit gpT-like protein
VWVKIQSAKSSKVGQHSTGVDKIWPISRQSLINDDLGAFGDMSAMMGRAAAETEARLLVDLLTANAGLGLTMDDGNPLFDTAAHGNEAASGTTIDAAALADGVLAMRVQKGLSGEPINLTPAFLLVSPVKEFVARQALASYYPATAADTNPLAGSVQILVEPRLTGNRWYLFASPAVLPVLEYSYLSSAPGPQMQSREGFDVLGIEFRVILDYGAGVLDWRGAYTNEGA